MDLSTSGIIGSLLVGTIGLGIFLYGKKQARLPQVVGGLVLMLFPYFVGSAGWMLAIAAALVAGIWLAVRVGC